jgi:hypothetical protein
LVSTAGSKKSLFENRGESGVIGSAGKDRQRTLIYCRDHLLPRSEAPRRSETSNRKNAIKAM